MQNATHVTLILLKSLLTEWNYDFVIIKKDVTELVTKVALDILGGASEATLNGCLAFISRANPALSDKISKMQTILSHAHTRSQAELEVALKLTDWKDGPNTNIAKNKIIDCYLTGNKVLELTGLNLTCLPECVKDLPIEKLFIDNNDFSTLPDLPPNLTCLGCRGNPELIIGSAIPLVCPLRTEIERTLELTDWEAGCNTDEAKDRIITCYLTGDKILELTDLELTSLPVCIKNLIIEELCIHDNDFSTLPDLPPSLTHLACSNNKSLTTLPTLPPGLTYLDCSDNPLLSHLSGLPATLTYLDCSYCPHLRTKPVTPETCEVLNFGNSY